jgi:hypothetical protein
MIGETSEDRVIARQLQQLLSVRLSARRERSCKLAVSAQATFTSDDPSDATRQCMMQILYVLDRRCCILLGKPGLGCVGWAGKILTLSSDWLSACLFQRRACQESTQQAAKQYHLGHSLLSVHTRRIKDIHSSSSLSSRSKRIHISKVGRRLSRVAAA